MESRERLAITILLAILKIAKPFKYEHEVDSLINKIKEEVK